MPVDVRTIRGVELVHAGTWQISNGDWTVSADDLAAAVDAHRARVLRKPVVKLGHVGPMGDASPALGYVDNLRIVNGGRTLVGDLVNVPTAVATLLPHAYPDRSVEALTDYEAPDGRVWPLVLTGLALLGASAPGVDTLASLQDVANLYGVAAARRVTVAASTFHPAGHAAAERRRAVQVAAARRRRTNRITIGV
ncbi:hypothetical protein MDOR_01620 [Mycolicibacterium doricum]|uniref:Uncharacterized protein n=1 Tax=Mycolicibacterium doricum TaxID=126673 RepID=A0A1X1TEV8_9MYCO|nr:hypothetical protein [Mycolicibacterium doricum]ORV43067.1 hypothetical protein AWC01_07070 [Mycolicibacterium doricum]BBZ05993.1 hypothetical protein MDOR_01620 [Mycolicibacterium doricum]